jgi:hypothetical protein
VVLIVAASVRATNNIMQLELVLIFFKKNCFQHNLIIQLLDTICVEVCYLGCVRFPLEGSKNFRVLAPSKESRSY